MHSHSSPAPPQSANAALDQLQRENEELRRRLEESEQALAAIRRSGPADAPGGADITAHKQAEEALRESQARLAIAKEAAGLGIHDYDVTTRTANWDARTREFWGIGPDEPVTYDETFITSLHPDDLTATQKAVDQALDPRGTGKYYAEYRIRPRSGGERWIAATGQTSFQDGKAIRLIGTVLDITERKQAEENLAAAHRQTQSIIDGTTSSVYACDLEARFVLVNTALAALFNTIPAQMIGKRRHEFMPQADADVHEANDRDVIATGRAVEFEEHSELPGRSITWLSTKFPLRDARGRIYGVAGIVTDISERKKVEEALRQSEERFRLMGDTIPYGAWMADAQGRNIYISPLFLKLVGRTFDEVKEFGWADKMPPEDVEPVMRRWMECIRTGQDWEGELRFPSPDGRWHTILSRGRPVRDPQGEVQAWVGINLDITERKAAEEALQASLHEKDVLLHEVHHRVKNNLQVISSLISLQTDAITGPEQATIGNIRDQIRAMALVHEQLYQSGDFAQIDFAGYARNLLAQLWRAHGEAAANATLRMDFEPVMLPLTSAVPCGLILNELAGNALKHAFKGRPGGGQVCVSLRGEPGGQASLRVTDNGVGLPEKSDWRKAPSLGLRLVQILSKQLGGTVEARPPSTSGGTEFEVKFPIAAPAHAS